MNKKSVLLDRVTWGVLIVLVICTTSMLLQKQFFSRNSGLEQAKKPQGKNYQQIISRNSTIYQQVFTLHGRRKFSLAMEKLRAIQKSHPNNPLSLVFQAQLEYGLGNLIPALHSYRQAVDLEPDYVDKNTPLFIGNSIMALINEAKTILGRERRLKPDDTRIKLAIEEARYLQRRIAGGCE